jgi:hypothetical protein
MEANTAALSFVGCYHVHQHCQAQNSIEPFSKMSLIWSLGISATFLLFNVSLAHFTINYPAPLGVNSDNEGLAPCGGFTFSASSSNTTEFHAGGDAIAIVTSHPQANILFRGSLDTTASGNWIDIFPVVGQYGLGSLC